ncbi:MAG: 4'-phosphopantetheinyl transferase family protein [Burkholderiales bacterium]
MTVWLLDCRAGGYEPVDAGRLLDSGSICLDERLAADRYRNDQARRHYLLGRVMLRHALSSHWRCAPDSWRFRIAEYGKPELEPTAGQPDLRFNLAHSEDVIVCAVSDGRTVGVDIESSRRRCDMAAIAARHFTSEEYTMIGGAHPMRGRFFGVWALKEAYLKALGCGLLRPLNSFRFHLADESAARLPELPIFGQFRQGRELRILDSETGQGHEWAIDLRKPIPDFSLALCAARAPLETAGSLQVRHIELGELLTGVPL